MAQGGDAFDKIAALMERPGVWQTPSPVASTDDVRAFIELIVTGAANVQTSRDLTAMITRDITESDTMTTTTTDRVKRDVTGGLDFASSGGKALVGKGSVGYDRHREEEGKRTRTTETSETEKHKLEEMIKESSSATAKFGPEGGVFMSAVRLKNLSQFPGYVVALAVELYAQGQGENARLIDSMWVCNEQGTVKRRDAGAVRDAPGEAPPSTPQPAAAAQVAIPAAAAQPVGVAGSPPPAVPQDPAQPITDAMSACLVRLPAGDPAAGEIAIPVRFEGFNTAEMADYLDDFVWLKVRPLIVRPVDRRTERYTSNVQAEMNENAVEVVEIPADQYPRRYWVELAPQGTPPVATLADVLRMIHPNSLEIDAAAGLIRRIGESRTTVEDWGTPATYTSAVLNEGAWVISSMDGVALDDPLVPGQKLMVAWVTRRDLLYRLDASATYGAAHVDRLMLQGQPQIDEHPAPIPAGESALCGAASYTGRRVAEGDFLRFELSGERSVPVAVPFDFSTLPPASDAADLQNNPYQRRDLFAAYGASEMIPVPGKWEPTVDDTLEKFAIAVRFSGSPNAIPLAILARTAKARVLRRPDKRYVITIPVTAEFLSGPTADVCLEIPQGMEPTKLHLGRSVPAAPAPPPGKTFANLPGPNWRAMLDMWAAAYPVADREVQVRNRYLVSMITYLRGRAIDDPAAVERLDHVANLSKPCREVYDEAQVQQKTLHALGRCDLSATDGAACEAIRVAAENPPGGTGWAQVNGFAVAASLDETRQRQCETYMSRQRAVSACTGGALVLPDAPLCRALGMVTPLR